MPFLTLGNALTVATMLDMLHMGLQLCKGIYSTFTVFLNGYRRKICSLFYLYGLKAKTFLMTCIVKSPFGRSR